MYAGIHLQNKAGLFILSRIKNGGSAGCEFVSCRVDEPFVAAFDDSDFFHGDKTFGDVFIDLPEVSFFGILTLAD